MKLLFFDLETTGLSRAKDEIINIAAISYDTETEKIIDTFDIFIKPSKPIPWTIERLTGITNQQVKDCVNESLGVYDFQRWVEKQQCDKVVGHNIIRFDIPFVSEKCRQYSIENQLPIESIDTLNLAKEVYHEGKLENYNYTTAKGNLSFKQEYLMDYYDFGIQTHTALDDIKNNILIYKKLQAALDTVDYGF